MKFIRKPCIAIYILYSWNLLFLFAFCVWLFVVHLILFYKPDQNYFLGYKLCLVSNCNDSSPFFSFKVFFLILFLVSSWESSHILNLLRMFHESQRLCSVFTHSILPSISDPVISMGSSYGHLLSIFTILLKPLCPGFSSDLVLQFPFVFFSIPEFSSEMSIFLFIFFIMTLVSFASWDSYSSYLKILFTDSRAWILCLC